MADPAEHNVSVVHALREWWSISVAHEGLLGTARRFAAGIFELLRDSTPERRRRRYGDIEYDWEHRVDTTSATVSFRNRLLGVFHSPYQATEPDLFHEMVGGLKIDYSRFVFVDLGSGKGRTLLMATDYPFLRIVGVELLPELHRVAQENVRKYRSNQQKCFRIETILADARDYEFPLEPLVVYLFNPFPPPILESVLTRIEGSVGQNPRPVYLLYHNPLLELVLAKSTVFKKSGGTHQYVLYSNVTEDVGYGLPNQQNRHLTL
jgi:SAM-dependent methyltransferase